MAAIEDDRLEEAIEARNEIRALERKLAVLAPPAAGAVLADSPMKVKALHRALSCLPPPFNTASVRVAVAARTAVRVALPAAVG